MYVLSKVAVPFLLQFTLKRQLYRLIEISIKAGGKTIQIN